MEKYSCSICKIEYIISAVTGRYISICGHIEAQKECDMLNKPIECKDRRVKRL